MTLISPARPAGAPTGIIRPLAPPREITPPSGGLRMVEEDGARKALGTAPTAFLPGTSLEHLARIAFG